MGTSTDRYQRKKREREGQKKGKSKTKHLINTIIEEQDKKLKSYSKLL